MAFSHDQMPHHVMVHPPSATKCPAASGCPYCQIFHIWLSPIPWTCHVTNLATPPVPSPAKQHLHICMSPHASYLHTHPIPMHSIPIPIPLSYTCMIPPNYTSHLHIFHAIPPVLFHPTHPIPFHLFYFTCPISHVLSLDLSHLYSCPQTQIQTLSHPYLFLYPIPYPSLYPIPVPTPIPIPSHLTHLIPRPISSPSPDLSSFPYSIPPLISKGYPAYVQCHPIRHHRPSPILFNLAFYALFKQLGDYVHVGGHALFWSFLMHYLLPGNFWWQAFFASSHFASQGCHDQYVYSMYIVNQMIFYL